MDIGCISIDDLQRFRLAYSVEHLAKLFEMKSSDMYSILKELGIKAPAQYLKECDLDLIAREVAATSHGAVAKRYGVSVSYLKSLYNVDDKLSEAKEYYERFGSPSIAMALSGCKILKARGDVDRYVDHGETTNGKGRRAELYVRDKLTLHFSKLGVVEDKNKTDPRCTYDFYFPTLGRINVKALKSKRRYWRLQKPSFECEIVAVYLTDDDGLCISGLVKSHKLPMTIQSSDDLDFVFEDNRGFSL